MSWELVIPWLIVIVTLVALWSSLQRPLGTIEGKLHGLQQQQGQMTADYLRLHQEAKREYQRLHQETRAEYQRLHQEMRAEFLRLHQETIRMYQEARTENIRMHQETREEIRREVRLGLQALRASAPTDGRPAATPIPAAADGA